MAHAGPTEGQIAALPLGRVINHRKLVATIFPWSVSEEMGDAPADQVEMFHSAASQGMLSSVLGLLKHGRFLRDQPDCFGRTALHWAAEQGRRNVVLALLRAGACVDARSQQKATPIMLAASRGHVGVVRVLIHYGAGESDCWPFNRICLVFNRWRNTTLHCAAAGGHMRMVEVLLEAGFDRGQQDTGGITPAEVSARQSHSTSPAITRLLLPTSDRGGKLLYEYMDTQTEDVAIVSGLVQGGAFLDWRDEHGETPLHRAVHMRHATISRVLLQAGADPNICDDRSASPLHVATCNECGDIVNSLLEAGADTELLAAGGHSPLHNAVANNRIDAVGLLLDAGASMEHRDDIHGQTALSWACRGCLAPMVRILVDAGADVEARSSSGLTPLHFACRLNDVESVEALINAGADPDAVDQAAADDAIVTSSSSSDTSVSRSIAYDVVGLGYSLGCIEDSTRFFTGGSVGLAARRLDAVSVMRIESALRFAKKRHSWCRRGWLVMIVNRCVAMKLSAVPDMWLTDFRGGCCRRSRVAVQSRCNHFKHPRCVQQKGVTSELVSASTNDDCVFSSDSRHPQEILSNRQNALGKRPSSVDAVTRISKATQCQQGQLRGDIRAQEDVAALLPGLVDALLELVAVEVDIFRRVVLFV